MKRFSTFLPTLALLSVLAACGGGDAPSEEMDMGGEAAPAAAPAAEAGALSCTLQGATLEQAQARVSPHRSLPFNIGPVRALLCYGAPSVRGRQVLNSDLIPYGQPWRMGADEPTTLHLAGTANVGGVALEAGSYSLYAIAGPTEWTIYINSNVNRWGIPIDAAVRATEVGSFTVTPQTLPAPVETLTYEYEPAAGGDPGGDLMLQWDTILIQILVEA
jgi:hypothetical protein